MRGPGTQPQRWDTFTQRLVLRELLPGLTHALLFFGFLVLFIGTLIVTVEADLGIPTGHGCIAAGAGVALV